MVFTGLVLASAVCSDLTSPTGVNAVSIRFRNAPLPRPDTIFVTVGDRVAPPVVVMLGQTEQPRARYVFSTTNSFVARPFAGGDSVEVVTRGSTNLIATLVGTTIGNNVIGGAQSQTADTVVLIAAAASNVVIPAVVSFGTLGRTRQLTAMSTGSSGQQIQGANIVWRSVNPAVVSVDPGTGIITSTGNGTADVYAIFEGVDSTFARITVQQTLDKYDLTTAAAPNLRSINETMTAAATAKDSLGNDLGPGSAVAPPIVFQSDDPGKIEIDPVSGVMTARANTTNPVRITGTVGGVTRSDTLLATVRQVAASISIQSADTLRISAIGGQILNVSVLAPDALGTQVPGSSITWTSANPAKAVVDGGATANITAQDTGTVKIAARADQQTDTVVVVVTNDAAAVVISPKPFELKSLDEIGQLTATVTNASGAPMPGAPTTWISRDSSIVEPQPQPGAMRARAIGETRVVVTTMNGRADSVTVRVTNAPDTVRIIPDTIVLGSIGEVNSTFPVDFKNGRGVALPKSSVTWTSADLNVASVAVGTGNITAQGAGLTYVLAVSPENPLRRDSVYVRVTNAGTSMTVSPPAPAALTAFGATQTFSATVFNALGNPIPAQVRWSVVSGGTFVTIDSISGVATAVGNGVAMIRATSGTLTTDVPLTVAQAISTITSTVSPSATSIIANGTSTTTITVQLRDANGNDIAFGGSTVAMSTSRGTLGTVADVGGGRYTATLTSSTAAGPATIIATANAATLAAAGAVTFIAGPATRYLVNASSLTPPAGTDIAITAQLADANNNAVGTAGSVVAWSSTGGGSFASGTSTTNAAGVATVTFTTSALTTTHTVTATTGGITGTSQAINTISGAPTNYLVTAATNSPAAGSNLVISAQLRDVNGNPIALANQSVTWTKSNPNGTFSGGGTSLTNGAGIATITLTTHTVSGTSTTVMATSAGPVAGTSATITTVAGAPARDSIVQAPSATVASGVAFPVQPTIQLVDTHGNLVAQANVSVTATIISGGGTLSGATTVLTDGTGLATFTDLAISGTSGARTLRFSTSGATPATAPVTVGPGAAFQIAATSTTSQSGTVGTAVASVPAVQVRDASNNPVVNHPVTFAITSGGGTTSPASGSTVNTNASGIATLTSWTLATTAGANALTATAAGLAGSPVSFLANGTPDVVTAGLSSVLRTGPDNVAANGVASSTITVTLRDQYGNAVPGRTVSLDDAGNPSIITPVSATSNASGQATFSVTSTAAGTVTYTATANDPGAIALTQTAQVTFGNPSPSLSSLSPAVGNRTQTLDVVFTGTGFIAGASTVNVGTGINVNSTTVNSATQLTANITITGGATTGTHSFSVSNAAPGGGTSGTQSFTVSNPGATLTGISPATAFQGENARQVILTGTGFIGGSTVNITGTGTTINSLTVNSSTQITLSLSIAAGATTGSRNVTVSNPPPGGGPSGAQTLTINAPPAPTLSSLAPNEGDRLGTMDVVLTGTNFASGVSSVDFGSDITVNSVTVNSATQITANVTIRAAAALGARNVTVTNTPAGGTSSAQTFTVNNPDLAIGTVNPNTVTVGLAGFTVATTTISGLGFVDNATNGTTVDFVEGDVTIVGTVTINSPTSITVTNISYPGTLPLVQIQRTLRVTNPGRAPDTFTITLNP